MKTLAHRCYPADHQMYAAITAAPECRKSTPFQRLNVDLYVYSNNLVYAARCSAIFCSRFGLPSNSVILSKDHYALRISMDFRAINGAKAASFIPRSLNILNFLHLKSPLTIGRHTMNDRQWFEKSLMYTF